MAVCILICVFLEIKVVVESSEVVVVRIYKLLWLQWKYI